MSDAALKTLSEIATEAHTRIQADFQDINPIVGVNRGMRDGGIPADVMTIDCLQTRKRIILVLHDQQPGVINYQYALMDEDPGNHFESVKLTEFNADQLYQWISGYFSNNPA